VATKLPLQRFKVIDLTHARAGPACVRVLADWGADVIRIEQPPSLDTKEELAGKRHGSDFQNLHRNKRAITLNLKDESGHEVFMKLAARADVIVENMRANVKHRLGIDYEAVRKVNPRIVYGSISGFGQDGPYAARAGVDQIAQGMGGLMSITGLPGQGPVRAGVPIADLTAGAFLAQGILIALLGRDESGEGTWVQTSLLEAQIAMLDFQAARWLIKGEVPKQEGNNHPTGIPTGVFETADGHINVAASGQRIYERLCRTLDAPELLEDERFQTKPVATRAPRRAQRADQGLHAAEDERRLGRDLRRGGRAERADQQHRSGLRRPPGRASGDGAAGRAPAPRPAAAGRPRRHDDGLPARAAGADARARREHRGGPRGAGLR
jgi:crotonobetainyl-CoA:carnitine CoA-transferase CaiB-like acyl-CoA transferase